MNASSVVRRLLAIGARGGSGVPLEDPVEVALIPEAAFKSDVNQTLVGSAQQRLRLIHPAADHPFGEGPPGLLADEMGKVAAGKPGCTGDGVPVERIAQVLLHVGHRPHQQHRVGKALVIVNRIHHPF